MIVLALAARKAETAVRKAIVQAGLTGGRRTQRIQSGHIKRKTIIQTDTLFPFAILLCVHYGVLVHSDGNALLQTTLGAVLSRSGVYNALAIERTFQMLNREVGRKGRRGRKGLVFVEI